jgi:hypothetical protein
LFLAFLAAVVAAGCTHPLKPYDQGRAMLERGQAILSDGDNALNGGKPVQAAEFYGKADDELQSAVTHFEFAERQIEDSIRSEEDERVAAGAASPPSDNFVVTVGSRNIRVARFHADTLRAYRESLALSVILRAMTLARSAEARYRQAAQIEITADQFYRARQFYAAEQAYLEAEKDFRAAGNSFASTTNFIDHQMLAGGRLAEVAPRDSWKIMKELLVLLDHRRNQTESYLEVVRDRAAKADRVVQAYRERKPGNIPETQPEPLPPLPDILRYGVHHPPLPSIAPSS